MLDAEVLTSVDRDLKNSMAQYAYPLAQTFSTIVPDFLPQIPRRRRASFSQ